jgi:hypothetical protein
VSAHDANSLIQFYLPKRLEQTPTSTNKTITGVIQTILDIPLHGFLCQFILVHPHAELDLAGTPYVEYPMMTTLVDAEPLPELLVIEPKHIITHLSVWKQPAGTYGKRKDFLVVCWALNRGHR